MKLAQIVHHNTNGSHMFDERQVLRINYYMIWFFKNFQKLLKTTKTIYEIIVLLLNYIGIDTEFSN